MKINRTSKQEIAPGVSPRFDTAETTVITDEYAVDKKGMPFKLSIKVTYAEDNVPNSVITQARALIRDVENANQVDLFKAGSRAVDKGTGEISNGVDEAMEGLQKTLDKDGTSLTISAGGESVTLNPRDHT